jgi:hypothetical protein
MNTPLPGQSFQVGSNWSSEQRKVAEVLGERTVNGEKVVVVKDELGYEQQLKVNQNSSAQTGWFSK